MKSLYFAVAFSALVMIFLCVAPTYAQEDDAVSSEESQDSGAGDKVLDVKEDKPKVNNLPQNFKGLTGLFFTTSTRVQNPGTTELGMAYLMELSATPEYKRTTYAFNGTIGIPGNLEFALHVPYVESNLNYGTRLDYLGQEVREFSRGDHKGMGSVEGLFKWAAYQQSLFLPAFALGLGFIAPGDEYEQNISQVKYFGARIMGAIGIEINDLFFTDYAFAFMMDGSLILQDVGTADRDYEEKHGETHIGMIFPILPRNYGMFIFEYEGILMRGTTNKDDENSVLAGLRFTTHHINLTGGAQTVLVESQDMEDRTRYFVNFSYKLGPPHPLFP